MRFAIFSDVHANLHALEAVLADAQDQGVDAHVCLGDLVGYGAHPREVLARVRALGCPVIAGNHDLAAIDRLDATCFNAFARAAIEWTQRVLHADDRNWLASLPLTHEGATLSVAHGTHDHPDDFLYLQTLEHAAELLATLSRPVGAVGHTHVPLTFLMAGDEVRVTFDRTLDLRAVDRALVNVGSVGQPRDEDPRASYVVFDDRAQRLEIRRIDYDIDGAARAILDAGLPRVLADRLRFGL